MSREGAGACRDFWSRRSLRLWAGGFVTVAAAALAFGFGATPRAAACSIEGGPENLQLPTLTSGLGGQTPQVGQWGTTLTLNEGSWTRSADCSTQLSTLSYQVYDNGNPISASNGGAPSQPILLGDGTQSTSGQTWQYATDQSQVGDAITADVTVCDYIGCTTETAVGGFAATSFDPYSPPSTTNVLPSGNKVAVNDECQSSIPDASNYPAAPYDGVAGSKYARVTVNWQQYEPAANTYTNPGGTQTAYNNLIAGCIAQLHAAGEWVLVSFVQTPCWATAICASVGMTNDPNYYLEAPNASACSNSYGAEGCYGEAAANLLSDSARGGFAGACGTYQGVVRCGVQAVEVWNEPNSANFWKPFTNPVPFSPAPTLTNPKGIGASATSFAVTSTTGIIKGDVIRIDNEQMLVKTPPTATTLTVTRAYGTTASAHTNIAAPVVVSTERQYETMLAAAYPQLHATGVTVVLGGTSHITTEAPTVDPATTGAVPCDVTCSWDYRLLTDSHNYGQYFDVVGVHTYATASYINQYNQQKKTNPSIQPDVAAILNGTVNNGNTLSNLAALCKTYIGTNAAGACVDPIWITEMGANVSPGNWIGDDVTNATMLTNFYTYIRGTCSGCGPVTYAFWFADNSPGTNFNMFDAGPYDTILNPKPEYAAFVNLP